MASVTSNWLGSINFRSPCETGLCQARYLQWPPSYASSTSGCDCSVSNNGIMIVIIEALLSWLSARLKATQSRQQTHPAGPALGTASYRRPACSPGRSTLAKTPNAYSRDELVATTACRDPRDERDVSGGYPYACAAFRIVAVDSVVEFNAWPRASPSTFLARLVASRGLQPEPVATDALVHF